MEHFGRYRILGTIGRGGMGTVYLAEDPFREDWVALKVPDRRVVEARYGAAAYHALFYNEMRAARHLRHPHIARLLDAGLAQDDYYIVMEYIEEAETLERFSGGRGLLSPVRVAELGFRCAEALDYAHRKGVVHRDLKPSNILLARDGTPRIVDFGIAQLAGNPGDDTVPLGPAGSPIYMSPEQVEGLAVTGRSDIYSLGLTLYELLTGVNPFGERSMSAIANRILTHQPPSPRDLSPDVPDELAGLVMCCLRKSPDARFPTARDLALALAPIGGAGRLPVDTEQAESRVDRLRILPFFVSFTERDIWELLRWAEWREYERGAYILRESDSGDELFIVVSGRVQVEKGGEIIAFIDAGECFGEMSFLADRERSANVVAPLPVHTLSISADHLKRLSHSCQVVFQRQLIHTLVARLGETTDALAGARRGGGDLHA